MHTNGFRSALGLNSSTEFVAGKAGQVVCRPAGWTDVVKFFLFNYGLHAITVITNPGDTAWPSMTAIIFAIAIPYSGILRAFRQIYKFPRFEGDPLQVARKAGALCTVVDTDSGVEGEPISPLTTKVHGQYPEYDGLQTPRYKLVKVPEGFTVTPSIKSSSPSVKQLKLANNYSLLSPAAAILQVLYGSLELYEASGHQFERFGYAAYSLSVIPYILMSLINLLASMLAPQYPSLFIVLYKGGKEDPSSSSSQLRESLGAGATTTESAVRRVDSTEDPTMRSLQNQEEMEKLIGGAVGVAHGNFLDHASDSNTLGLSSILWHNVEKNSVVLTFLAKASMVAAPCIIVAMPYIIIKLLTNFEPGQSTTRQRYSMTFWLVIGQVYGYAGLYLEKKLWTLMAKPFSLKTISVPNPEFITTILHFVNTLMFFVPTFCGFVVVAEMILSDQICQKI